MNVSTRGPVKIGEEVMIAGFIVSGDVPKRIVLRGIGPSLTPRGVVDAIADPALSLNNASGTLLAYNDDYSSAPLGDRNTLASNRLTPTDPRESAIVATLDPGSYTAILRGKTNGNGMVEVYDIASTAAAKLKNISTRSRVDEGDNGAMIAGFIISAPPNQPGTTQRIVIRALGPSLRGFGVAGTLADTTLDLYRGSQLILSNDNWKTNAPGDQQTLQASGLIPASDKEAAIVTNLDPGSYTAVVRGKNNTVGVALAEVYQLSQ